MPMKTNYVAVPSAGAATWTMASEPGKMTAVATTVAADDGSQPIDPEALDTYKEFTEGLQLVLQRYDAAMREMVVRFEILDQDFSLRRNRNPIHHIESRIKQPVSIYEKLLR